MATIGEREGPTRKREQQRNFKAGGLRVGWSISSWRTFRFDRTETRNHFVQGLLRRWQPTSVHHRPIESDVIDGLTQIIIEKQKNKKKTNGNQRWHFGVRSADREPREAKNNKADAADWPSLRDKRPMRNREVTIPDWSPVDEEPIRRASVHFEKEILERLARTRDTCKTIENGDR